MALVANLMSAIGAAPYFGRPRFDHRHRPLRTHPRNSSRQSRDRADELSTPLGRSFLSNWKITQSRSSRDVPRTQAPR
jgi:hypothetical protein